MTPEAKVKARIKRVLAEVGAYYAMPVGTGLGNSGVPDFLVCFRGKFIGIEAKAGGRRPTALQEKHLNDIRVAGGTALVIDETNVENLKELLK
jgi:pantoate kinase